MMNFLRRDKPQRRAGRGWTQLFRTLYGQHELYYRFTDERLAKSPELLAGINIIAGLLGSLTVQVWAETENGSERVKNGLSYLLDIEPSPNVTRFEWVKQVVTTMYLDGICLVAPTTDKRSGLLKDLKILTNYSEFSDEQGRRLIKTEEATYVFDELIKFSLTGAKLLDVLKQPLTNLAVARKAKERFFKSSAAPNRVVYMDLDVSGLNERDDKNLDIFKDSIEYSVENGLPMFMEKNFAEVKDLNAVKYAEVGLDDAIADDVRQIAGIIGVPSFFLGVGSFDRAQYNLFITTTFLAIVRMFEQSLSRVLLSPKFYVKYDTKKLLNISPLEQAQFVVTLVNNALATGNEGRSVLGMSPVDDPGMNEFRTLENYIPVDKAGAQKKLNGGADDETTDT